MTNEAINVASDFQTLQDDASNIPDETFSTGLLHKIKDKFTIGSQKFYPLLDFMLFFTSSTLPTENGQVRVYRVPGAYNNESQPTPGGDYKPDYVGTFVIDNVLAGTYYFSGVTNSDIDAKYILYNDCNVTASLQLLARTRTYSPAP